MKRYDRDLVGYFAAVDKQTGQIVGQIGLMWNDIQGKRCLEIGYILKKAYWGKGYATEGAEACLSYGFELFGTDRIYAAIRPENRQSIAVADRLGMTLTGEYTKKYEGKQMRHLLYIRQNESL
jgi:RimJ/RimL family protein N-acetyltransferase